MNRFLIWGTGCDAERYLSFYEKMEPDENRIMGFTDSDSRKWGRQFHGRPIYRPDEIKTLEYDYIDIWSSQYGDEIYRQITQIYGISQEKTADIFLPYKQRLALKYAGNQDPEIAAALHGIMESRGLEVYSFEPLRPAYALNEVFYDDAARMHYILFEGKRMYLRRGFRDFVERDGKKYTGDMYREQDPNSPHRYEGGGIIVEEGDTVVDAGACEGNFSLHHIDRIGRLYLVECDEGWMEALRHTFEPYKEKVVFCSKFLSDADTQRTITLDTLTQEPVDFLKMDIEGAERAALRGGRKLLERSAGLKCAICAYHRHGDEEQIRTILKEAGLTVSSAEGYMLFLYDDHVLKEPELRRGIVRGRREADAVRRGNGR